MVGLDAEGTRDLVQDAQTGLLLRLPPNASSWPTTLKNPSAPLFDQCALEYAKLLAQSVTDHSLRTSMGQTASTEGIKGFTWWDAMESCVDGYRESIRVTMAKTSVPAIDTEERNTMEEGDEEVKGEGGKISRVNRVVSRRLAHRDAKRPDTRETIWHLSTSRSTCSRCVADSDRNPFEVHDHAWTCVVRLSTTPGSFDWPHRICSIIRSMRGRQSCYRIYFHRNLVLSNES